MDWDGTGTTTWLGIGGIRDVLNLFKTLGNAERDTSDTGEMKHVKKQHE